jgi:threonine/homoserine/homoserine lactone efflux protein
MQGVLIAFSLAFIFSFLGSIPPGTLNVTMMQLGLDHRLDVARRFALACAIVEYPYAWLAVEFKSLLISSPYIEEHIELLVAVVMVLLGAFNFWSSGSQSKFSEAFHQSGFRRGVVLSILNPLALPYWIGITAYLESMRWISLTSPFAKHAYLLGVSLGAFVLLMLCALTARIFVRIFRNENSVKRAPGLVLIALGLYALVRYLN